MNIVRIAILTCFLSAPGCITININFPAKEVQEAAEEIVGEARPEGQGAGDGLEDPDTPADPAILETAPQGSARHWSGGSRLLLASFSAGSAFSGEEKDEDEGDEEAADIKFKIDTPKIKAIRANLVRRFPKLKPFYEKGNIGEKLDGYLLIREEKRLSLKEKRDLKMLADEENKDRKNLYQEIVKENKFEEERLKDVQKIFAAQWIKKSRTGWWIQNKKGEWIKKPPPKEKKKEA